MIAVTDEGSLTRALVPNLEDEVRVVDTPWQVREDKPEFLIHTYEVGYGQQDRSEMWNVNVWRVLNLARAANSVGATNVFFSTFMIFDGKKGMYTENTPPSPLNYYGITKLTGESAVAALGNYLILRVGLLYGIQSSLFAPALRNMMVNRKALCPSKFYVSPIGVKTFSRLVGELIRSRVRGIFNVATQRVDFHEFCRKVGDILGTTPIPAGSSGRDFSLDVWLLSTLGIKVSINYDVATMFGGS